MDVGSFLVVPLDIINVGLWRGLCMLELEECITGVRERLRSWEWFCDFGQLLRSLEVSARVLSCDIMGRSPYMLYL